MLKVFCSQDPSEKDAQKRYFLNYITTNSIQLGSSRRLATDAFVIRIRWPLPQYPDQPVLPVSRQLMNQTPFASSSLYNHMFTVFHSGNSNLLYKLLRILLEQSCTEDVIYILKLLYIIPKHASHFSCIILQYFTTIP